MPKAQNVYDPVENLVHVEDGSNSGNVTLCGQTDWIRPGKPASHTSKAINCRQCLSVIAFVKSHEFV